MAGVEIVPLPCTREFVAGDDLADYLARAVAAAGGLRAGDIVVVTQKAVSKCEGRVVRLSAVSPSPLAQTFAQAWDKDARVVELALRGARRVVRMVRGVLITQTHHGFICANSGVDRSNTGEDEAVLLPEDPDSSAQRLRLALGRRFGVLPVVIITDTFGRAWRRGQTNVAIGLAGARPFRDYRGSIDHSGRELHATVIAVADEIAAASELVMNKADGVPAALVRGYAMPPGEGKATDLVRATNEDLFL